MEEARHISTNDLDLLGNFAASRAESTVENTLRIAREQLGMDVSFVAEFDKDWLSFRGSAGDMDSFAGIGKVGGLHFEDSYCKHVAYERAPYVVTDAKNDERTSEKKITKEADIGSYLGVPVVFSDGEVHGVLCTMSHSPNTSIKERDIGFIQVLSRIIAEQLEREELEKERQRLALEYASLQALVAALSARDGYTGGHSESVLELASAVAERMGFSVEEINTVRQAALLHDVGKISVPDVILKKPSELDDEEREIMREHPSTGEAIVSSIPDLSHLSDVVSADHERWDGRGYPKGLVGEEIPLVSRIVFACDVWDAMSSDRPYRKALTVEERFEELDKASGAQLDPKVVEALKTVLRDGHFLLQQDNEGER